MMRGNSMEKYIITITRQFGSMGRPIAKNVAEKLKIPYYDRDIVEATAKHMNLPVSVISDAEESADTSFFRMKFPLGTGTTEFRNQIFNIQKNMIYDIASKQTCIIVGRCSDYILKDMKNHVSIYIYSPYEERLKNCIEKLGIKENKAADMIASVDNARRMYHKRYANYLPDDIDYKKILIDSSFLGIEGTAELIVNMIRAKFY